MPKIPGPSDHGGLEVKPGRGIITTNQLPNGAAGRGLQALGNALESAGGHIARVDKAEQAKRDTQEALEADTEWQKNMNTKLRTYETDPDYSTYDKTFTPSAQAITKDAASRISNPKVRKEFELQKARRAEQYRDRLLSRGIEMERQANLAKAETNLEKTRGLAIDPNATPEERAHARADGPVQIAALVQSGTITPAQGEALRRKFKGGVAEADTRIAIAREPDKLIKDYETWSRWKKAQPKPQEQAVPLGNFKIFDNKVPSHSERREIFKQGGQVVNLDANWSKGGKPTGPLIVIPDNASPETRKAAQEFVKEVYDLNKRVFGRSLPPRVVTRSENGRGRPATVHTEAFSVTDPAAVKFYSSDEGRKEYAGILARTLGKIPGVHFSIPHDPSKKLFGAEGNGTNEVKLAQGVIEALRGGGTINPVDRGQLAGVDPKSLETKPIDGGQLKGVDPKSLSINPVDKRTMELGDHPDNKGIPKPTKEQIAKEAKTFGDDPNQQLPMRPEDAEQAQRMAELDDRFGSIPPDKMAQYLSQAQRRISVNRKVNLYEYRRGWKDHLAALETDGVGMRDFDERIKKPSASAMEQNEFKKYVDEEQIARAVYKHTNDIKTLTNRQIQDRQRSIKPTGAENRSLNEDIFKAAKKRFDAEIKRRTDDPALAVDDSPDVQAARELAANNIPDRAEDVETGGTSTQEAEIAALPALITARLEAQREIGIDTPRTITKQEAAKILPNIKKLPEAERYKALQSAWQAVQLHYGEHAEQVMKDALHYSHASAKLRDEEAGGVMRRPFSQEQMSALDQWRKSFSPQDPATSWMDDDSDEQMFPQDFAGTSDQPQERTKQSVMQRAAAGEFQMPTMADLEQYEKRGAAGAAEFDSKYYEGAFADAISYREAQRRKLSNKTYRSNNMPSQ